MPLIAALSRQKQVDLCGFEANLIYKEIYWMARVRVAQKSPVWKHKKNKNKEKKRKITQTHTLITKAKKIINIVKVPHLPYAL